MEQEDKAKNQLRKLSNNTTYLLDWNQPTTFKINSLSKPELIVERKAVEERLLGIKKDSLPSDLRHTTQRSIEKKQDILSRIQLPIMPNNDIQVSVIKIKQKFQAQLKGQIKIERTRKQNYEKQLDRLLEEELKQTSCDIYKTISAQRLQRIHKNYRKQPEKKKNNSDLPLILSNKLKVQSSRMLEKARTTIIMHYKDQTHTPTLARKFFVPVVASSLH